MTISPSRLAFFRCLNNRDDHEGTEREGSGPYLFEPWSPFRTNHMIQSAVRPTAPTKPTAETDKRTIPNTVPSLKNVMAPTISEAIMMPHDNTHPKINASWYQPDFPISWRRRVVTEINGTMVTRPKSIPIIQPTIGIQPIKFPSWVNNTNHQNSERRERPRKLK